MSPISRKKTHQRGYPIWFKSPTSYCNNTDNPNRIQTTRQKPNQYSLPYLIHTSLHTQTHIILIDWPFKAVSDITRSHKNPLVAAIEPDPAKAPTNCVQWNLREACKSRKNIYSKDSIQSVKKKGPNKADANPYISYRIASYNINDIMCVGNKLWKTASCFFFWFGKIERIDWNGRDPAEELCGEKMFRKKEWITIKVRATQHCFG